MKKTILIALALGALSPLVLPRVSAQSASFIFSPSGSNNVAPGSSITFAINLNVTTGGALNDVQGLTYFFEDLNGGGPFFFTITARDLTGSPFDDAINNSPPGAFMPDPLDPSNDRDLGALAPAPLASGNYFIANLTVSTGSAPAGMYTIRTTNANLPNKSTVTDSQGDSFDIPSANFTITVIPEPSTYALLSVAALGAGIMAMRRRQRAVS